MPLYNIAFKNSTGDTNNVKFDIPHIGGEYELSFEREDGSTFKADGTIKIETSPGVYNLKFNMDNGTTINAGDIQVPGTIKIPLSSILLITTELDNLDYQEEIENLYSYGVEINLVTVSEGNFEMDRGLYFLRNYLNYNSEECIFIYSTYIYNQGIDAIEGYFKDRYISKPPIIVFNKSLEYSPDMFSKADKTFFLSPYRIYDKLSELYGENDWQNSAIVYNYNSSFSMNLVDPINQLFNEVREGENVYPIDIISNPDYDYEYFLQSLADEGATPIVFIPTPAVFNQNQSSLQPLFDGSNLNLISFNSSYLQVDNKLDTMFLFNVIIDMDAAMQSLEGFFESGEDIDSENVIVLSERLVD